MQNVIAHIPTTIICVVYHNSYEFVQVVKAPANTLVKVGAGVPAEYAGLIDAPCAGKTG
jgi:hypothetical protein